MKSEMERVYLAGPYSSNPEACVRAAAEAAARVIALGRAPFVPHLYHFVEQVAPQPYERWMAIDFAWIDQCDVLVRLPGQSPGADREVAYAQKVMPVFFGMEAFELRCSRIEMSPVLERRMRR